VRFRVAACYVNSTPLDWAGNLDAAREALELARLKGASVALLPELCLSGYGCEDAFLSPEVRGRSLQSLLRLLPETRGLLVALTLPLEVDGRVYNAAALCVDGRLAAFLPKQNLANDGVHYEARWFSPWTPGRRETLSLFGVEVPVGDWLVRAGGVLLGAEICEDAWVEPRPARALRARGANLVLCPAASHFALGKAAKREELAREAGALGLGYLYANLMGNEAGRIIFDGGALAADLRGVVAHGARFSFKRAGAMVADLELDQPGKPGAGEIDTRHDTPHAVGDGHPSPPPAWSGDEEEFTRAVALGLFDYARKSRCRGFTLSLSGGADSAATAVLVHVMESFAAEELGEDALVEALGPSPRLRCAYQSTAQSGAATLEAARAVAKACGAEFHLLPVEPLVAQYRALAEKALGRHLSWERDDLTLQNLQARVRSPSIWALANATQSLLLATSNRSEAAVGYATMDGDTSGGLAPLAGIGKHFLRGWLRWMELQGPRGFGPLGGLAAVNALAPTAELRPPEAGQTDERDLMPYELLDALERLAIERRLGPLRAFREARGLFPALDPAELRGQVARFFRLWSRSQWKRERLAPSFHLDRHNVDPRSWCRFPILSGGFEQELGELDQLPL
jgi:NAD+ synthase (glutamine-hydrolysing)